MTADAQGEQQYQDHSPDDFGFESDVDLLIYSVVQHMREQQFDVADRDFILRSFLPSHAQQALVQRDKYTHPSDWMLAVKFGRNRDAYEDKQLVKAGFPERHPDNSMYMHIKDQCIYLNDKYPNADWVLLMDKLYDRLTARTVEQPPDLETMRRSSLYAAFVKSLDNDWEVPQLDSKSDNSPDANAIIPTDDRPHETEPETVSEVITVEEIHLRLGYPESTVKEYLRSGEIPGGHQTGHLWVVNREAFEVWFRGTQALSANMSAMEVAEALGVSAQTARAYMAQGEIPFGKKIGKSWVMPRDEFMGWLRSNTDAVRALKEPKPRSPTAKPEPDVHYVKPGRSASF